MSPPGLSGAGRDTGDGGEPPARDHRGGAGDPTASGEGDSGVRGGRREGPRGPAARLAGCLIAARPGWISPPDVPGILNKCRLSRELIRGGPQPSISARAAMP